jgi:pimeloyl-ACP methyl ester carboxylesterase
MALSRPVHVVFVHGLFSSADAWDCFTDLISADQDLSGAVMHCFEYNSPKIRIRPDRRIAEVDDLADSLRTYLSVKFTDDESIVLVSHSLGGLVVQRMLARTLQAGQATRLARIKLIVMYACPNTGSEFLIAVRRLLGFWRNPQERVLRPIEREVIEAQKRVLAGVVNAHGVSDTECAIPMIAIAGLIDNVVPTTAANWVFPKTEVVDGDHFAVIRPANRESPGYVVLRNALIGAAEQAPETAPRIPAERAAERPNQVTVTPPFGKLPQVRGRDGLLKSITSSSSRVRILAGLGGSGKSTLALEMAKRAQQAGQDVWWINVNRINTNMREVATQLGASDSEVDRAWLGAMSAPDLVWRLLNAHSNRWLLVFDDADNPKRLGPLDGAVSDGTGWLRAPAGGNGTVIVTSRDRDQATWGSWAEVQRIPPLEDGAGAAMLMDIVGYRAGTYEQARLLSQQLGGLPFALKTLADYLKSVIGNGSWTGDAPIKDFEGCREYVKRRFESPPGEHSRDLSEPVWLEIIQGALDPSLDLLAENGLPQAPRLLKVFACLGVTPIPYRALLNTDAVAGSQLFTDFAIPTQHEVLAGLASLGLIEQQEFPGGNGERDLSHVLTLHPVVHGVLRDDAEVQQRRAEYYGLSIQMLRDVTRKADPDDAANWRMWDLVVPHAIDVCKATLLSDKQVDDVGVVESALQLARPTARYLIVRGLLDPAEKLVEPVIANCRTFGFDPDDRQILALRHEKARIALERGDPVSAEQELRLVIEQRTLVLGEKDADTLASKHKLAKAILEQGRWAEAEPLLKTIVTDENKVRGPRHSDTMVVRHSLCRAILALGRFGEAELMARDILKVRNEIWSSTTPETLFVRETLTRSLLEQDKWDEAETEVRAALATADRLDSPRAMELRGNLVLVLFSQGRYRESFDEARSLIADQRRVLGESHPRIKRTAELLSKARELLDHPDE